MTSSLPDNFNALVLNQQDEQTQAEVQSLSFDALPDEKVLVHIDYSSINYKDSLAVTGTGKIVRTWPMVPGIDFAGTVVDSDSECYPVGQKVIMTGWSVGEKYWGGYSQYQRINPKFLVPLPETMSSRHAMLLGTAGLTAMLCVMALEQGGVSPDKGPVVVSGAAGGVGSITISLLSKLGYEVTAVSGRSELVPYLQGLGAKEVISRDAMAERARPLEAQKWAGGVDTVGDAILARMLAETDYGGVVAACGLAMSFKLPTTVMPFILRNVRLQGVDSVMCPFERRQQAWQRLAELLPESDMTDMVSTVGLSEIADIASQMIAGKVKGRVLVDVNQ